MTEAVDVVIVGAGPAGLAAGIVLARHDVSVLVCDAKALPIDKPCGEGVLPHGRRFLRQLDVDRRLDMTGTRPFVGIRFHSAHGAVAEAPFAEGPGLGVRRLNLSRALAATASAAPRLEIRQTPVLSYALTAAGVEVRLPGHDIQARLLIGADGLKSRVRRWAGLDAGLGRCRRLGARQHFQVRPWSDHVEVHYGPGIEAYVTPSSDDTVGVAFLWDKERFAPARGGGGAALPSFLSVFPELAARLGDAQPASPLMATGPLHRKARGHSADGVLLLGDAGGYLDACTGEGISLALAQALSLEATLVPALKQGGGAIAKTQLQGYERACRDISAPYVRATRLLLFLSRQPLLFEGFLAAVRARPDLLTHLFSAQMGLAPFWIGWSRLPGLATALPRVLAAMWKNSVQRGPGAASLSAPSSAH